MITCTRKIHFCSGHRVLNHESKCANLHGHNYVAWVTAVAPDLDNLGRIIDFSVLKEKVGGWIDEKWDHTTILYMKDLHLYNAIQLFEGNRKVFLMPTNPTAENMASYLLHQVCPIVLDGTGVEVNKIQLFETENCYATAEKTRLDVEVVNTFKFGNIDKSDDS